MITTIHPFKSFKEACHAKDVLSSFKNNHNFDVVKVHVLPNVTTYNLVLVMRKTYMVMAHFVQLAEIYNAYITGYLAAEKNAKNVIRREAKARADYRAGKR